MTPSKLTIGKFTFTIGSVAGWPMSPVRVQVSFDWDGARLASDWLSLVTVMYVAEGGTPASHDVYILLTPDERDALRAWLFYKGVT